VQRRHLSVIASVLVIAVTAGACSRSADTTAVDAVDLPSGQAAPTSTIMRSDPSDDGADAPATSAPSSQLASAGTDPTAVLTQLLGQFAADPALLAQLSQLDAVGIANLLGIDLSAIQDLGLTPVQLTQLAQGVAVSAPSVQQQLVTGAPDPAVLLGLLAGSLDLESLTDGTIATIVQGLLAAVTGLRIVVSPELTVDLGELLADLDPEGLGPLAANPANAALLALITSAWIGSNPLLAQQLLANPQLDPALRTLLQQLQELSGSIGDTARTALLEALYALIPALDPNR
jgi:hypothetical protein